MSEFRLSPEAVIELDDIWFRIARQSSSIEIATRLVDSITQRFWLLALHPYSGRQRADDLRSGLRSFPADDYLIIYRVEQENVVLICTSCTAAVTSRNSSDANGIPDSAALRACPSGAFRGFRASVLLSGRLIELCLESAEGLRTDYDCPRQFLACHLAD